MLVGASNLNHSVKFFETHGMSVADATQPGWVASAENVKRLAGEVEAEAPATAAFVFDLLGSVRFEQYDGTTALPFKSNGKFHLGGKIVTTPPAVFRQIIDSVMPIIKAKGAKLAVIIPPLPRYLFTRCCSDADHCTNANDKNFSAKLLTNFVQLRNELIKQLVSEGITNFKVMDLCCVTNCSLTANTASRLEELKKVTASDGVHFTGTGYTNLAKRCSDCLKTLLGSMCNPKGKKAVPVTFFWRGF